MLPFSENIMATKARIQKCVKDLEDSVKPMLLPFKVLVRCAMTDSIARAVDVMHNMYFENCSMKSIEN
ncbi:hypothetical protein CEQ28_013800 [Hafnia alvei]|nr:hypothetical protein CEQ28_013800 [Hafnia alvei]